MWAENRWEWVWVRVCGNCTCKSLPFFWKPSLPFLFFGGAWHTFRRKLDLIDLQSGTQSGRRSKGKCNKHESAKKIPIASSGSIYGKFVSQFEFSSRLFFSETLPFFVSLASTDNAGMQAMAGKMLAKRSGSVAPCCLGSISPISVIHLAKNNQYFFACDSN